MKDAVHCFVWPILLILALAFFVGFCVGLDYRGDATNTKARQSVMAEFGIGYYELDKRTGRIEFHETQGHWQRHPTPVEENLKAERGSRQ